MGYVVLLIGVVLFLVIRKVNADKKTNDNKSDNSSIPVDVDNDFVRILVNFYEGYLTLCSKYRVQGHAFLTVTETNEFGYKCDVGCNIFAFEGKNAVDSLDWIKRSQNDMLTSLRSDGYEAWKQKRDGFEAYMEETFIGLGKNLHYCYSDPEEWIFREESRDVLLSFDHQFFISRGKWNPTLVAVKDGLIQKFPNADIQVYNNGIMIK